MWMRIGWESKGRERGFELEQKGANVKAGHCKQEHILFLAFKALWIYLLCILVIIAGTGTDGSRRVTMMGSTVPG